MSVSAEVRAEILRRYHAEKWLVGTIARQLHVHHSTVRRAIEQEGEQPAAQRRARKIDAYVEFIKEQLSRYPTLTAARLHAMVTERGYTGQQSQFRALVSELRVAASRPREAFLRLRTLPGEQAQVDWAHFGRLQIGRAERPLMAFVLVLSYSRAIFVRFFLSQSLSNFMYGHQFAFTHFGGVTRVCLFDNLRSVVCERIGKAIRFNRRFMEFAAHYRFEPRPVAVARGNEKGRVERSIRYLRENFFAARRFNDLNDLNAQALAWCQGAALERRWPDDDRRTVREVLEEEKGRLLALPATEHPCAERAEARVEKYPQVRFDLNDYSVPPRCVHKTLTVYATLDTVRICDGTEVVATHARSYDRHKLVESEEHRAELKGLKSAATEERATNVLSTAAPSSVALLVAVAEQGTPLRRAKSALEMLRREFGGEALERAIGEAIAQRTPNIAAVRQVLERQRHDADFPVPLPLELPDDPRVRAMALSPSSLTVYDQLQVKTNKQENKQ